MRRYGHYLFLFALCAAVFVAGAQNKKIDSLRLLLVKTGEDTARVSLLNKLSRQLRKAGELDSAIRVAQRAGSLAINLGHQKGLAFSYTLIGKSYSDKGNYPEALSNYLVALKIYAEIQDARGIADLCDYIATVKTSQGNYKEGLKYHYTSLRMSQIIGDSGDMATSYSNIGATYHSLGNYTEALQNDLAALKIREALGDKIAMAITLTNIGNVYFGQENYPAALEKYFAALKITEELGEIYGKALCYNNIGATYTEQGNYREALKNHFASLKMKQQINDVTGMAVSYNNIGLDYANLENYPEAFRYYFDALKIQEELGDKEGIALLSNNIGLLYVDEKKFALGRDYLTRALRLGKETGSLEDIRASYEHLATLDSMEGNYASSLVNYKLHIAYRDSMNNEENTKKTVQAQMNYEFDKKEAATKLEQEKRDTLAAAEAKKQRILLIAISGFGLLILGFAVFAYRSFLQKKKANSEISRQKELIEEKQKEILDSIYYARRIQNSLMPNEKYIDRVLTHLKAR